MKLRGNIIVDDKGDHLMNAEGLLTTLKRAGAYEPRQVLKEVLKYSGTPAELCVEVIRVANLIWVGEMPGWGKPPTR